MSTPPKVFPEKAATTDTVTIPLSLLQKMSEAAWAFEAFQHDLEDYLLARDADLLARMRRAREDHLKGQTRPLDELKRDLCIE